MQQPCQRPRRGHQARDMQGMLCDRIKLPAVTAKAADMRQGVRDVLNANVLDGWRQRPEPFAGEREAPATHALRVHFMSWPGLARWRSLSAASPGSVPHGQLIK